MTATHGSLSKFYASFRLLVGSQLRRNLVFGVCGNGLGVLVAMATYPVYLRYLGLREYGIWLALSSILALVQLGALGISPAVTKYVSEALAHEDREAAESYAATAFLLLLGTALLVAIGLCFARTLIVRSLNLDPSESQLASSLIVPVAFVSAYALLAQVPFGTLSGIGRTDQLSIVQLVGKTTALLVAWQLLARGHGLYSLVWSALVSQILMHATCEVMIWRSSGPRFWRVDKAERSRLRTMLRFGFGMVGSTVLQMAGHPLNRILLSRHGGLDMLPHFEVAFGGAMQVRSLLAAGMQAFLPEFSHAAASRNYSRIRMLNRRAWILLSIGALPLFGGLLIFAPELLRTWLGTRYAVEQVLAFRLMLVAALLSLLGVPGYYFLLGVADVRAVFVSQLVQVIGTLGSVSVIAFAVGGLSPATMALSLSLGIGWGSWHMFSSTRRHLSRFAAEAPSPANAPHVR